MKPKQRIYLVQINGRFGLNCYVPYSVGLLWAYARTFPEVIEAYELGTGGDGTGGTGFLYLKERVDAAVAKLVEPDLIALSLYIWNFEWSKAFARAVKARWPGCEILVGGVQVPDESPRILAEHPYFDWAIYGEGEGAFAEFLRERLALAPDYSKCGSLIWRSGGAGDEVRVNARRPFTDLAELRSPYLDGVFDALWGQEPRWQILQETNRGCPYTDGIGGCSFCAWGQAALNDLRLFPTERVLAEIDWFGQHRVPYADNADANFAIVKRDVEFAKAFVAAKQKYGFPQTFRTSFAKKSNDVVWDIANIFHAEQMLKSVTLSMQSMDDNVLLLVRRKNIKFEKFGDLVRRYESAGIPTYTELIMGLPGETLDSFLDGIDKNLEAGQKDGLFCYMNLMLENTEQNTAKYREIHGLRTARMQAMLTHGTPDDGVREIQETVVETSAMPHADWRRAYLHAKVVEVFHSQGLLQEVAVACREGGTRYRDFYSRLTDWVRAHPETVAGREFAQLEWLLDGAVAGGSWDCVDSRLGEISWPPEEFMFARICCELESFYDEISDFIGDVAGSGGSALLRSQREAIAPPTPGREAEWAREVVWFGRKGYARKKRAGVGV